MKPQLALHGPVFPVTSGQQGLQTVRAWSFWSGSRTHSEQHDPFHSPCCLHCCCGVVRGAGMPSGKRWRGGGLFVQDQGKVCGENSHLSPCARIMSRFRVDYDQCRVTHPGPQASAPCAFDAALARKLMPSILSMPTPDPQRTQVLTLSMPSLENAPTQCFQRGRLLPADVLQACLLLLRGSPLA